MGRQEVFFFAVNVSKNSTVTSAVKNLKSNTSYKFKIRAYKTVGKTHSTAHGAVR